MAEELPGRTAVHVLRDALPPFFRQAAPFGTELWQWLLVPALLALTWIVALALARVSTLLAGRLAARSARKWDDALVRELAGPVRLLFAAALTWLWVPALQLPDETAGWLTTFVRAVLGLAFFWALFRGIAVAAAQVGTSPWAIARPGSKSLVSLGARVARVALFAAGVVTVLSGLGYPVASLVAGLGLGGLALALAAQKTVENLFGAFAIAVDQPFREGDFVKIEDWSGTVESIGMRSTRIRTLDRTLISVPNGKLADARIETFAARDRIRLACTVGLAHTASAAALRAVLSGLTALLEGHPRRWPHERVVVKLKELGPASIDVEVNVWFATADWAEFQDIRQELLIGFLQVIEEAGTALAFPRRAMELGGALDPRR